MVYKAIKWRCQCVGSLQVLWPATCLYIFEIETIIWFKILAHDPSFFWKYTKDKSKVNTQRVHFDEGNLVEMYAKNNNVELGIVRWEWCDNDRVNNIKEADKWRTYFQNLYQRITKSHKDNSGIEMMPTWIWGQEIQIFCTIEIQNCTPTIIIIHNIIDITLTNNQE